MVQRAAVGVCLFFRHVSRDVSTVLLGRLHCGNVQLWSLSWVSVSRGLMFWSCSVQNGLVYITVAREHHQLFAVLLRRDHRVQDQRVRRRSHDPDEHDRRLEIVARDNTLSVDPSHGCCWDTVRVGWLIGVMERQRVTAAFISEQQGFV